MVGLEPTRLAPHDPKSCSSASFDTSPHKPNDYTIKMNAVARPTRASFRIWLERISIGLVAIVSLLVPLIIGLLFYLALTDGIVVNDGDPAHEVRLWMIRESRGATGVGFSISTPAHSVPDYQCAQTRVSFLKWDRTIRIETADAYCTCYLPQGNQYKEVDIACPDFGEK